MDNLKALQFARSMRAQNPEGYRYVTTPQLALWIIRTNGVFTVGNFAGWFRATQRGVEVHRIKGVDRLVIRNIKQADRIRNAGRQYLYSLA